MLVFSFWFSQLIQCFFGLQNEWCNIKIQFLQHFPWKMFSLAIRDSRRSALGLGTQPSALFALSLFLILFFSKKQIIKLLMLSKAFYTVPNRWFDWAVKSLYSGHHQDLKIVTALERCPLRRSSSQIGLFCFKNLL